MPNVNTPSLTLLTTSSDCGFARLSPEALELVASFFKVLSEVNRLRIACVLKSGPRNVTEIMETTELGQANVSKHLKMMAQAGIVKRTQQGVSVYYEIANPMVFPLCDLVCNSLTNQLQQSHQHIESLHALQKAL